MAWADKIRETMLRGYAALGVMEKQLQRNAFIAGDAYTIADIALYAYTHVAHEGDYRLDDYPQLRAWLARVEQQDRFIPMQQASGIRQP